MAALQALAAFLLVSCDFARQPEHSTTPPDSLRVVEENMAHRAAVETFFRDSSGSPFRRDTSIRFRGLSWFPIDPSYRFSLVLRRYENPETVVVMGTRGEERRHLRYGYFEPALPDSNGVPVRVRINVYTFTPADSKRYALYRDHLSLWFTDLTTGVETYHVGRYIDIGTERADPAFEYVVDFNKAYNPYCAYSSMYSCAIPRKEDHLPVAVRAGERIYH